MCISNFEEANFLKIQKFWSFKNDQSDVHAKEKHDVESQLIMENAAAYTSWVGQVLGTQSFSFPYFIKVSSVSQGLKKYLICSNPETIPETLLF